MSLWKTLLLFLDVWGMGNRGMFRTLRDLILRPGYLICDYLNGKRSAYFPPFKLLFLLTTLSLLVGHGFNVLGINYQGEFTPFTDSSESEALIVLYNSVNAIFQFQRNYPAIFMLIYMGLAGYFFYIFFKKSKILGKLTFNEFFIGLVYMVSMYILYTTFFRFFGCFGLNRIWSSMFVLTFLIPLKQLSGYSWGSTILRSFGGLVLGGLSTFTVLILLIFLVLSIYN